MSVFMILYIPILITHFKIHVFENLFLFFLNTQNFQMVYLHHNMPI